MRAKLQKYALALGLLAALLTAPFSVQASEIVKFVASQPFSAKKVTLKGELFRTSQAGPRPTVILMHGCAGWQPAVLNSLRSHALYLVTRGFNVLNLDSFGPRTMGNGWVCKTFKRLRHARSFRTADAIDAARFLRSKPFVDPKNIFLMGQSNGGSVALKIAKSNPKGLFRAVAAYYPWCGLINPVALKLSAPLIVFGGNKDDWVPPDQCARAKGRHNDYRVKVYSDAAHSFDLNIELQRFQGKLVGRNTFATKDSRKQMVNFFKGKVRDNQS